MVSAFRAAGGDCFLQIDDLASGHRGTIIGDDAFGIGSREKFSVVAPQNFINRSADETRRRFIGQQISSVTILDEHGIRRTFDHRPQQSFGSLGDSDLTLDQPMQQHGRNRHKDCAFDCTGE